MAPHHELCVFRDAPDLIPSRTIVEGEEKRRVISRLNALYGIHTSRLTTFRFPGSNPASIGKADLEALRERPYLVGLKTDGVRYILLLTMDRGEPRAIMVDRKMSMYEIEVWAPISFFESETVLDGELCWERVRGGGLQMIFLVFDTARIRESLLHSPFSHRLEQIHRHMLSDVPAGVTMDSSVLERLVLEEDKLFVASADMRIAPKKFVPPPLARQLWEGRGLSLHKNDGLILVDADSEVQKTGTDRRCFKWKPASDISVDVLVDAQRRVYAFDGGDLVRLEKVRSRPLRIAENDIFVIHEPRKDVVYECSIAIAPADGFADGSNGGGVSSQEVITLFPIRIRNDKTTPNDIKTISLTVDNVEENIQAEEICERLVLSGEAASSERAGVAEASSRGVKRERGHQQI